MWHDELNDASFGKIVPTTGGYQAFVPANLPPQLTWTLKLAITLSDADRTIGQLSCVGLNLPSAHLLINPFIRREAILSSRIEETQADSRDLYLFEEERRIPPRIPDTQEVANYVQSLEFRLKRCDKIPISLRLIRELHHHLMTGIRGDEQMPGKFRTSQNIIGPIGGAADEATFVPPPPVQMASALDAFEKFIHRPGENIPALIHYQFEAIHPFRDGNGRIGRLLITLLLCVDGILSAPLLYLSVYFECHRKTYYEYFRKVSTQGKWWIGFF